MLSVLIFISLAALWGWLLRCIAERRGAPSTAAYPAIVGQPYLSVWIIGVLAAALLIWSVR